MTAVTVDGKPPAPDDTGGGGDVESHVDRRAVLRTVSRGTAATAVALAAGGGLGGVVAGLLPSSASASASASATASASASATAGGGRADAALDIQILQTAASLETLMIDLYAAALGSGPLGLAAPPAVAIAAMTDPAARTTLVKLLTDAQAHHREHRLAFQSRTTELGGKEQTAANPKYASGVASADVSSPDRMVDYAAVLEKILTDTYVLDLTLVENVKAKETLASVMAVEAQHLAVFRAVGALMRDDLGQLAKIPIGNDLVNLPPTLAAAAFPKALEEITSVAEPASGAVP